jgi:hypothetical protein
MNINKFVEIYQKNNANGQAVGIGVATWADS